MPERVGKFSRILAKAYRSWQSRQAPADIAQIIEFYRGATGAARSPFAPPYGMSWTFQTTDGAFC